MKIAAAGIFCISDLRLDRKARLLKALSLRAALLNIYEGAV